METVLVPLRRLLKDWETKHLCRTGITDITGVWHTGREYQTGGAAKYE